MITKEQKQLIQEVKRESGTNEFLSVSDLIVRIEENYKKKDETLYYEDAGITFSLWNDFLRNTPLSMDLFIGEEAIFEGFEVYEKSEGGKYISFNHNFQKKALPKFVIEDSAHTGMHLVIIEFTGAPLSSYVVTLEYFINVISFAPFVNAKVFLK